MWFPAGAPASQPTAEVDVGQLARLRGCSSSYLRRPRGRPDRARARRLGPSAAPPWRRSARPAACSCRASAAFCSTSMMSLMILGARPVEGSSSTSTSGCKQQCARNGHHLLLAAAEQLRGRPVLFLEDRKEAHHVRPARSGVTRCLPLRRASARFSATVMSPNRLRRFQYHSHSMPRNAVWRQPRADPRHRAGSCPERARKCPLIVRTSVDLPAPLAPSRPTTSPLPMCRETAMEDRRGRRSRNSPAADPAAIRVSCS